MPAIEETWVTVAPTGVVIRNHFGELIQAQTMWYQYAENARLIEALKIPGGIRLAIDLGLRKVIIESDAQEVVRMFNNAIFERADISVCYDVQKMSSGSESFILRHVN